MSDELPANLRPVADSFGLPDTAPVAKDFHVMRAIRALGIEWVTLDRRLAVAMSR